MKLVDLLSQGLAYCYNGIVLFSQSCFAARHRVADDISFPDKLSRNDFFWCRWKGSRRVSTGSAEVLSMTAGTRDAAPRRAGSSMPLLTKSKRVAPEPRRRERSPARREGRDTINFFTQWCSLPNATASHNRLALTHFTPMTTNKEARWSSRAVQRRNFLFVGVVMCTLYQIYVESSLLVWRAPCRVFRSHSAVVA